jgi:hypothetical protein
LIATLIALVLSPALVQCQQSAVQKLTLAQIEGLIVHNVPDATLSNQIRLHGLSFAATPAILDGLRTKGAGPLTLAAIASSRGPSSPATPGPARPPSESRAPSPRSKTARAANLPGNVELQTEPGSTVFLDGKQAGSANSEGLLTLSNVPAGNHELSTKNDGFQDSHLEFVVASSEDKQVSIPLVWLGGYLAVSVQPGGAAVTVSGPKTLSVGPTEVKCPPGSYTVTVSLDGYTPQTRSFQIAAEEHHSETFQLGVDPAALARELTDAKKKLDTGDPAVALSLAEAVLKLQPDNADAEVLLAGAAFQQGDMNRFVDAGSKAIRNGKPVTVRTMHAHTIWAMWIHPMDFTISESGISLAANPPDSRCKVPTSVGFDLIQSASIIRDPQRGFIELHIQYAAKPHGAILHDLDFVPEGSQVAATRQPGQVFGSGASSIQEPASAGQTLDGILRLMVRAKR